MEDFVDDEDLLIEAARFAIKTSTSRNNFMSLAKRCWYQAEAEHRAVEWRKRHQRKGCDWTRQVWTKAARSPFSATRNHEEKK